MAVQSVGMFVEYKPRGAFQTRSVNPVLAWSTLLSDPVITTELIDGLCRRAIGILEGEDIEREDEEKS